MGRVRWVGRGEVGRGSGFTIVEEGGGVRDGFEMRREMKIEGR